MAENRLLQEVWNVEAYAMGATISEFMTGNLCVDMVGVLTQFVVVISAILLHAVWEASGFNWQVGHVNPPHRLTAHENWEMAKADALCIVVGGVVSQVLNFLMDIRFGDPTLCIDMFSNIDGIFWIIKLSLLMLLSLSNGLALAGLGRLFVLVCCQVQRLIDSLLR